ncbi:uncharacterized protein LOC136033083 [Artemia franciscana]
MLKTNILSIPITILVKRQLNPVQLVADNLDCCNHRSCTVFKRNESRTPKVDSVRNKNVTFETIQRIICEFESKIPTSEGIQSLKRLLTEVSRNKDETTFLMLVNSRIKIEWRMNNFEEAVKSLKKYYKPIRPEPSDAKRKNIEKSACRSLLKDLMQINLSSDTIDYLYNFTEWCGSTRYDWKPMAFLWMNLIKSKDVNLQEQGICIFKKHGPVMNRYVPRRIVFILSSIETDLKALNHLLEISKELNLIDIRTILYEKLLHLMYNEKNVGEMDKLLKEAASASIRVSPSIIDKYAQLRTKSDSSSPLDTILLKHGLHSSEETNTVPVAETKKIDLRFAKDFAASVTANVSPSFEMCLKFLRILAENGAFREVENLIDAVKKYHRSRYFKEGELKRFLAEALWKQGDRHQALQCIKDTCEKYKEKRQITRRLRNVFCVCVGKTSDFYHTDVIETAEWFGKNFNDFKPLAVLWRYLITSEIYEHIQISERIFESYGDDMASEIPLVLGDISKLQLNEDELRRLIESSLTLNLRPLISILYSLLLDKYCDSNNIILADEVFNSAMGLKIQLCEESLRRYLSFRKSSLDVVAPYLQKKKTIKSPIFELKF